MITIDEAIKESKKLPNISDGGAKCYDFGDVVLVKYTMLLKYVTPEHRARENQEIVMRGINNKVNAGVNTPKHIAMKRVVEDENDVCYVLQEKCKGKNCAQMSKYGESVEAILKELKYICDIPFKHYEKLVADACMLYEMGYEAKNKNLFYDEETGFWFIDFLDNKETEKFDANNPKKVFESLKYVCPDPLQIAPQIGYNVELSDDDKKKYDILRYSSKAKFFIACKNVIPIFSKYEYFYLLEEDDLFKKYLMENNIVNRDLFTATSNDFEVYNELFTSVVSDICNDISTNGKQYWDVEANDIRNKSRLFGINLFYKKYICNDIKREEYVDEWEYDRVVAKQYTSNMLNSIYNKLCSMKINENIARFISEYEEKKNKNLTL